MRPNSRARGGSTYPSSSVGGPGAQSPELASLGSLLELARIFQLVILVLSGVAGLVLLVFGSIMAAVSVVGVRAGVVVLLVVGIVVLLFAVVQYVLWQNIKEI